MLRAKYFRLGLLFTFLQLSINVAAQWQTGPQSVVMNELGNYSYKHIYSTATWSITPMLGTVENQWLSVDRTIAYADIRWNAVGSATITLKNNGVTVATRSVTITCGTMNPPTFTVQRLSDNAMSNVGCVGTSFRVNTTKGAGGAYVLLYSSPSDPNPGIITSGFSTGPLNSSTTYYIATTYDYNDGLDCVSSIIPVPITVYDVPTAAVINNTPLICSGEIISITASITNAVPGASISRTLYAPNITSVIDESTYGAPESLLQVTSVNQTATYTYTPSANGCIGTPVNGQIVVKPIPTVAVSLPSQQICTNQLMNAVSITNPNSVAGTVFSWNVTAPNITGANAGSGTTIQQTLSQTTDLHQNATYTITPTANGCLGTSVQHSVTVDPYSKGGNLGPVVEVYGQASGALIVRDKLGNVQAWQQRSSSGSWTNLSGEANDYLNYSNIPTTMYYRVLVKSGVCPGVFSSETSVVVHAVPVVSIIGSSAIAPGGGTQLHVQSGYDSYQWYKDNSLMNGANLNTLSVNRPGLYKVSVKATSGSGVYTVENVTIGNSLDDPDPTADVNYIRTFTFGKKGLSKDVNLFDLSPSDYAVDTKYFDDLGRPMQSVTLGASPGGGDLIQPIDYDDFGREEKKYLPYAHSARDGRYQTTALADQSAFYTNGNTQHAQDVASYSHTIFESSPLNRVIKQGAPGADWQPNLNDPSYDSTDHSIQYSYEFNGLNEVLIWKYQIPSSSDQNGVLALGLSESGSNHYDENQLHKNRTKDENKNEVIEFVDKQGRTILKRVQVTSTVYADTYYVYDDFGNLVVVLPPQAVAEILKGLN